ncbi:MAG TPA: DUF3179 domain-containing protein [Gaiellaceae bacterium]|nr:DUF3179 domain-containing protein [Gaiellaceae bacterium]
MKRRRFGLLALLVAAVAAAAVVVVRAAEDGTPDADELGRIAEEINRQVPNVGLGEGSPAPPDAGEWKTDFSKRLVPLEEFQAGGPPKDGIPAIDNPRYRYARDVDYLEDREPVILVRVGDDARAYPLRILVWHEIVNARFGNLPVAVTFCPLCNTAIVFDRRVDRRTLSFGTTGMLRDSDLVMYDRQTESWWQQFGGQALVGRLAGKKLRQLPARIVAWEEFRRAHPDGLVLDIFTGFSRNYGANPYPGYDSIDSSPLFPVRNADDDRLPAKERVVYVEVDDHAFAVPYPALAEKRRIEIDVDGKRLVVTWRRGVASALDDVVLARGRDVGAANVLVDGRPVPFTEPFWFTVAAFRPDIEIVED